jgi:hypothetical protein
MAQVTLYEEGFDGLTNGSLVGAPQSGWEGFGLSQAGEPEIAGATDKFLQLTVNAEPADNAVRQESRAVLTLPTPVDLTQWTQMTVEYELTLPAGASGGSGERHNFYYDFDGTPNRFGPMTINDGGAVGMIDGTGASKPGIATNPETLIMKWVFDLTDLSAITADTFYGATQVDDDVVIAGDFFADDEFSTFSIGLAKDFRTAPFGYTGQIDDFKVTAVPEPASLGLLALAGLFLRRRG